MEVRKTELLKTEEDLKIQLAKLEQSLLEELANAKGSYSSSSALSTASEGISGRVAKDSIRRGQWKSG